MGLAKTALAGLTAVIASLPGISAAQDDPERNIGAPLVVQVDVDVSNLSDDVAGLIITCHVNSLFESSGVVGAGKVFIYSEAAYPTEVLHESEVYFLPISFISTTDVFGYGGTRSFNQTVEVLLDDPNESENGSRLESWVNGLCALEVVGTGWTLEADYDEIEGMPPTDCSDGQSPLFTCVRPGTSVQSSVFTFERDFAESVDDDTAAN